MSQERLMEIDSISNAQYEKVHLSILLINLKSYLFSSMIKVQSIKLKSTILFQIMVTAYRNVGPRVITGYHNFALRLVTVTALSVYQLQSVIRDLSFQIFNRNLQLTNFEP